MCTYCTVYILYVLIYFRSSSIRILAQRECNIDTFHTWITFCYVGGPINTSQFNNSTKLILHLAFVKGDRQKVLSQTAPASDAGIVQVFWWPQIAAVIRLVHPCYLTWIGGIERFLLWLNERNSNVYSQF